MEEIRKFQQMIDESRNIVFFGGAGVSTESNIPDFRSEDGLYNMKYKYPPETIISHTFFLRNPEEFYRFYKDRMLCLDTEPNRPTGNWPNWSRQESSPPLSLRILTGFTRRREAGRYMNCTEVFTEITAWSAVNFMMQSM